MHNLSFQLSIGKDKVGVKKVDSKSSVNIK